MLALLAPAVASAQQPVATFSQLNTRLKPGDRVWVTDAQGREHSGKITDLGSTSLTLGTDIRQTFTAADVRLIQERRPDSLANGALIGLGVGALVGFALACVGEPGDADCVVPGSLVFAGIGAGIGVGIDALIPAKKRTVYQGATSSSAARLTIAPVITPRRKGVALRAVF